MFDDALGVDMQHGDGVDIVHDMERPLPKDLGQFDHVVCVSVLEHCRQPWKVARTIESCLVREGTIYLSVPVVWRFHAYPNDYWRFLRGGIEVIFPRIGWTVIRYQDELGRFKKYIIPRYEDGRYGKVELHAFGRRR